MPATPGGGFWKVSPVALTVRLATAIYVLAFIAIAVSLIFAEGVYFHAIAIFGTFLLFFGFLFNKFNYSLNLQDSQKIIFSLIYFPILALLLVTYFAVDEPFSIAVTVLLNFAIFFGGRNLLPPIRRRKAVDR